MTPATNPQEKDVVATEYTFTGGGYTLKLNGDGHAYLFNGSEEEIKDIAGRNTALTALSAATPLLAEALKNEANERQKEIDLIAKMAGAATAAFVPINDNQKKPQLGDQMPDTSYYMGVSEDTGTDFYLFIESAGQSKTADVVTFNKGTDILRKKHEKKETFHGHKFSAFQLESEIIQAQKDNKADGGNRRLTKKELAQVETVFKAKPELRTAALDVCSKDSWVQSASPCVSNGAWFQYLRDGGQNFYFRYVYDASLLVGRSDPQPKVG